MFTNITDTNESAEAEKFKNKYYLILLPAVSSMLMAGPKPLFSVLILVLPYSGFAFKSQRFYHVSVFQQTGYLLKTNLFCKDMNPVRSYLVFFHYKMQKTFLSIGVRVRWLSTIVLYSGYNTSFIICGIRAGATAAKICSAVIGQHITNFTVYS